MRPTACPDLEIDFKQPKPCANISNGTGFLTMRGMWLAPFTQELGRYVDRMDRPRGAADPELKGL